MEMLGRIPGRTSYTIYLALTLCPEDPLRDMLERIPGCTAYTVQLYVRRIP